jgi:hypothetical protein
MDAYQGEIYMPDVRADLIDLIWDLHKDARNFKPRGVNWDAFSVAELEAFANRLGQEIKDLIVFEREQRIEEDRRWRDDIALGVVAPTPDVKLEPWEIWEARAEVAGFGA